MQGWTHWLMGAGFFGFAMFELFADGSAWSVGLSVVAAGYLFYRALTDQTGAPVEDLELAVNFVRNPYDTIFDQTVDQLAADNQERRRGPAGAGVIQSLVSGLDTREMPDEEQNAFDPDAAIARYLANRPAPEAATRLPSTGRAVNTFGRKQA